MKNLRPRLRRLSRLLAWLLAAWAGPGTLALAQVAPGALPAGGQVVVGSGTLVQSPNLLVIQQHSGRLGMDWQSFNIGSGATVEFRQPSASAVALNRVLGHSGSEIYGQLRANGQVFLTNPNGVLFAPGARVDVGGLVASTLDLTQQDFADGRYVFSATSAAGTVRNQGTLNAAAGGYLALFGTQVVNQGDLQVQAGSVVLASGRAATVSISGSGLVSAAVTPGLLAGQVDNAGRITADGGVVTLSAKSAQDVAASLVNNTGIVRANTLVERGGEIWITGDQVASSGTLAAAAPAGGDGGRVSVLGDMQAGTLALGGQIDVSAAAGRGGAVDTSAARVGIARDTRVDSRGAAGTGRWLIDPTDFTIAAGGAALTSSGIGADTLSANLASTNITLQTAAAGSEPGDIHVNAAVAWSANTILTLDAARDINLNASITATGLSAGLDLITATGRFNVNTTDSNRPQVTLSGANATFRAGTSGNALLAYTLVRDLAGLQAMQGNLAGRYALAVDIDASGSASSGFTPIGNETATGTTTTGAFTGTFEGLGHRISGLTVNRSVGNSNAVGLFASTNNATLRNFELLGGSVSGRLYVGAVAGYTQGSTTLSNVRSSASVTAATSDGSSVRAGGLVGLMAGSTAAQAISDSVATGNVSATVANSTVVNIGGLVGEVDAGSLSRVRSGGNVTVTLNSGTNEGNIASGGLVGRHSGGTLANTTATGNVSGGIYAGGLVGYLDAGSVSTARAEGQVSGSGDAGGLIGYATGTGSLTAADALGAVNSSSTSSYSVGGAVGYLAMTGALSGITAAGQVSGGAQTGGVVGYYNPGTAVSAATLTSVNHAGKTITGSTWVGGYIGYMNQAASVSGLVASSTVVATGTSGGAGGIVGRSSGAVSGSSAGGSVSGGGAVGGLIGVASGAGGLSTSSASATVTATGTAGEAGGLVGRYNNTGNLDGGSASGAVQGGSGSGAVAGGLVGTFDTSASLVNGSTALSSSVSGGGDTGGLVGQAFGSGTAAITGATVRGSVSGGTAGAVGGLAGEFSLPGGWSGITVEGAVSGGTYAGGLAGWYGSNASITGGTYTPATVSGGAYAGGVVGYVSTTAAITGPSAASPWVIGTNVTTTGNSGAAGGLVGRTVGAVTNIRTTGTVTAADDAGGVVGRAEGSAALSQLRATGSVSSSSSSAAVGGVVGLLTSSGGVNNATGTGNVAGGRYTGGVVGYLSSNANLQALRGEGNVSGAGDAGGVIGFATGSGSLTDAAGLGTVTSSDTTSYSAGGALGYFALSGGLTDITAAGNVTGATYTGGVVGYYNTSAAIASGELVYTSSASRTVTGRTYVGGLIGYSNASSLTGLSSAATVVATATNTSAAAGGLVGRTAGSVTGSSATGNVSSGGRAGGLVGDVDGNVSFTDTSASGNVSGSSIAGGLIGQASGSATLLRASASGNVTTASVGGGLVGAHNAGAITDSNASGNVTGLSDSTVYIGGLVGTYGAGCYYCNAGTGYTITNSHATGAVRADASGLYVGGLIGYVYSAVLNNVSASGNVTAVDAISPNSNEAVGGLVGYFGIYNQRGSITGSNASGSVSGGYYSGGLVGFYNGAAVSNSSATGAVSGGVESGGLIGYANLYGPMDNVSATGAVTASQTTGSTPRVGGLMGRAYFYSDDNVTGGSLTNGAASGNVTGITGRGEAGGLVGLLGAYSAAAGPVNDSRASGRVAGGSNVGGLIGYFDNGSGYSALLNSTASGAVSGGTTVGGLVGYYYRTASGGRADDITNSSASGAASGVSYVGGLVGRFEGRHGIVGSFATGDVTGTEGTSDKYLGGLAGSFYSRHAGTTDLTDIHASYASGRVALASGLTLATFTDVYAGGLVGYLSGQTAGAAVVDAYASGAVALAATSGRFWAGGLVGYATGSQSVLRAYATGAVSASGGNARNTGGLLAGRASTASVVTDSHWDSSSTGQATSVGGGTARSTAEMRQAASFTGWDLNTAGTGGTVWRQYEGYTAPLVSRFLTPRTVTLADTSKVYDGTQSFGTGTLTAVNGSIDRPERIFVSTPSADVGVYSIAAAGVYSVQNGYDLTVSGSAQLTVTPRPLTLAGVVADKVYDGTRTATLLATAQPAGVVPGETLTVNTSGASAVFDTRNAGQNKTVTITGLSLADGANGKASNYQLASSTSTTASITPAPLNVGGFTATSRAYDGSVTVSVSANGGSVSGVIGSDDVTANLGSVSNGSMADKNVGNNKPVTVLGATLSGADAGNYVIAGLDTVTVNITPRSLTVNGLRGTNRAYNQSTSVSVPTGTGELSGVVPGDVLQLRGNTVTGTMADRHAGNGKAVAVSGSSLQLRGTDAANYTLADATATVDIARAVVSFDADYFGTSNDKVYDGNDLAPGVTPYAYSGATGYLLAGTTTYGLDNLVLSYDTPRYADKNVSYSGANVTSKTITASNATLGGTDAGNYVLANTSATTSGRITPRPLAVTGVTPVNRTYDGTVNVSVNVAAASVDTSQLVPGDNVSVTVPGSGTVVGTMANKNAGTGKAVTVPGFGLSGTDATNYTLTGSSGVTVDIARKPLTASYSAQNKVYDGNAYATLNVSSADIVGSDVVRFFADQTWCSSCGYGYFVTAGSTPTAYTLSKDAGTGKTVVVTDNGLYGADAANYTLQNPRATVTADITPKGITPVFSGVNKVYDGSTTATVTLNTGASGIVSGDALSLTRNASFDTKDAGTGKTVSITDIAFSGAAAGNYTLSTTTATTTAAITPKPLAVAGVSATDRAYDGSTSVALVVGTLGVAGVVGNDTVTVAAPPGGLGNGSIANKNVGSSKPVTVSGLTLGGADAANYSIDGSQGVTVNITPRGLTAVYTGSTREYNGGVSAAVTVAAPEAVAGDVLSFTQNAIYTGLDARNVGSNKPILVTSIVLGGADAANYSLLNTTASTTGSITPKGITVGYTGLSRAYNGLADTSASVSGSSAGLVAGDQVGFAQTATFAGDGAVGSGKAVNISGITLTGAQAANYSVLNSTATTTASITPRLIGVTGVLATSRVYDGSTTVQLSTAGATVLPSGVLAGDTVTVVLPAGGITTGTMATKDAGSNKPVSITGLTLSGASAANYAIGGDGLTVNITPRPLTAVYSAASRVYDGSTTALITGSSSDILPLDVGALSIVATGRFTEGKNVGNGKAVAITGGFLSGAERNNYSLVNPSGSALANITPRSLTASFTGGTRVYDGGVLAPVTALGTGVLAGDTVGTTQTAVFSGSGAKNVGSGKAIAITDIVLTGADAQNYVLTSTTASATGTVTPKPISIDGIEGASATARVYDGSNRVQVVLAGNASLNPSSADIVAGDSVTINLPEGGITTGLMADKNAGLGKNVVVEGLTLGGADAGNYLVAATTGITVDIARKALTAQYSGINRVYDGSVTATVGGSSPDIVGGDAVLIGGGGVFTGDGARNVGTSKTVNVLSGTLSGADAANYTLLNPTGSTTASITPRPVTPVYSGLAKVYDGTATALVQGSGTGFVNGDAVQLGQTAVFTGAGAKNVGTGKAIAISGITLLGDDAGNYVLTATDANATGSITPKPLRITGLTGVSATDRAYDGSTTVSVTVSASGPIAPNPEDVVPGDVLTLTAPPTGTTTGTLADKNVGNNKPVAVAGLSLGGADAANYSITATSGVTVNITPRLLTAVYSATLREYDGSTAVAITGSSADIVAGDALSITGTGAYTGPGARNAGSGKLAEVLSVSFGGADAGNYSLVNPAGTALGTVTPRALVVGYTGGTRVYDGSTEAPVIGTLDRLVTGDDARLTQTAVFTGAGARNVGTAKPVAVSGIALAGSDAANYTLNITSTSTAASVTPRPLRIEGFTGVTATDRVYDGSTAVAITVQGSGTLSANTADLVPGDAVTVVAPVGGSSAGTVADKNVGSNKPVTVAGVTLSGADAGNYSVAAATGVTVNITPRPLTAVWTGESRVYDGSTRATVVGSSADIVAGDLLVLAAVGEFTGPGAKNVGSAKGLSFSNAVLAGADALNYLLTNPSGTATADITPRTLTASVTGGTRVYDGSANAPVTTTLDGLIAGDAVAATQTALFTGAGAKNVGEGKAVQVSGITLQGSDAGNYVLASDSASTTASVTPRPLNVSGLSGLTAVDRVYDGTREVQITGTLVVDGASGDVVAGDDVGINLPGGAVNTGLLVDKNAGNNRTVALSGLTLSGADAANYAITGTAGLTVNIAPRPVALLGVAALNRLYDGTAVVALDTRGGSLQGVLPGDTLQLLGSGVTGTLADKNVGTGKAVTVGGAGFGLAGSDAANYSLVASGLTVDISPRTLLVSVSGVDKVYDGNNLAQVVFGSDALAGDQLSLSAASSTFASANAGSGLAVVVSGLTLAGADALNYRLADSTLATSASILRRAATLTANSLDKLYGDTLGLPGSAFSVSGLVQGESLGSVTLASAGADVRANVGSYTVTASDATGGSANLANYLLSYAPGTLRVLPRPLTVAANSVLRFDDEANPAQYGFSTSTGGLVNGDSIAAVRVTAPAASVGARGVSVFTLQTADALFGSGSASNYALSYGSGLLLVLPTPPRVGDVNAGSGEGPQGLAVLADPVAVARAEQTLERLAGQLLGRPTASPAAPGTGNTAEPTPEAVAAAVAALLAADPARVSVPALQNLPLLSFEPGLRRLLAGAASFRNPPATPPAP